MSNNPVKIGTCFERHINKYEGATQIDYIEFSRRTARKVAISRCDQEICEIFNIYTVSHLAQLVTELPDLGIDELEYQAYLIDNSKNPYEIAKLWQKAKSDAESWVSVESIINEYLSAIPKEDFERWGDKNCLSDVSNRWFKKDSINIDVKVEEINAQSGIQITIEDCIDFVKRFRPNGYKNPMQIQKELLENRFKEMVGFNLKDYYAEHLIKSCEFCLIKVSDVVPF